VVCQLDALVKCRNRVMLRKSLAILPPTLDKTYDRILSAISEEDSEYAIRILRWLAFSRRPLLVEEVSEIVAIDVERDPVFDCEEVLEDPLEALNICSSLVTIAMAEQNGWAKPARPVIVLAHYSVEEYLISERSRQGRAARYCMHDADCNEAIARGCLGYLLRLQRLDSLTKERLRELKLAQYSAEFWISQIAEQQAEVLSQLVVNLFSTRNIAYLNWIRIHDPDRPWEGHQFGKVLGDVPAPLYYAACSGLTRVVKLLLKSKVDVNAQGGYYGNALYAASAKGHEQMAMLLLDSGAHWPVQDGTSRTR